MKHLKKILFLCVANSARSQIAEGLANTLLADLAVIKSAGSNPSGLIQPWAIQVLKEIHIDISHHKSKSIQDIENEFIQNLDYIITLCAEEICPIIKTSAQKLHWPINDPAVEIEEKKEQAFILAREEIKNKILNLKSILEQQ